MAGTVAEAAAGMFFFVSFSFSYTNVYFRSTKATAMTGSTTDNHSIIKQRTSHPFETIFSPLEFSRVD
jgi:hypothetical protein